MKKLTFLLVLIGLCVWPVGLRAQSAALMEAYQQGATLYQAGRYDKALPFWKKALELSQREFGPEHPSTANLLNNLAGVYLAQRRYAEAEPLQKRSLALLEKALGAEHPNVATSLENYSALLRKTGRGSEAVKLEARARVIRAKRAKENPAN